MKKLREGKEQSTSFNPMGKKSKRKEERRIAAEHPEFKNATSGPLYFDTAVIWLKC